jgi:hypothetical protein
MNAKIKDAVQDAVDEALDAIRYNLREVFGGLLYSLKLEMDKKGNVGVIDRLISIVMDTSEYKGPENEEYPAWIIHDRFPYAEEKKVKEYAEHLLKTLTLALHNHGIQQSWNIGKEKIIPDSFDYASGKPRHACNMVSSVIQS